MRAGVLSIRTPERAKKGDVPKDRLQDITPKRNSLSGHG